MDLLHVTQTEIAYELLTIQHIETDVMWKLKARSLLWLYRIHCHEGKNELLMLCNPEFLYAEHVTHGCVKKIQFKSHCIVIHTQILLHVV